MRPLVSRSWRSARQRCRPGCLSGGAPFSRCCPWRCGWPGSRRRRCWPRRLPPAQAVRGLLVLRGLTRQLEQDAAGLRAEQDTAQRLAASMCTELGTLRDTQAEQSRRAAELDAQIAASREIRRSAEGAGAAAARRAAEEAGRASGLREMMARIEAEQRRQDEAERQRMPSRNSAGGTLKTAASARRCKPERAARDQARQDQLHAKIGSGRSRRGGSRTRRPGPFRFLPRIRAARPLSARWPGQSCAAGVTRQMAARQTACRTGRPRHPAWWRPAAGGWCLPARSAASGRC